MRFKQAGNKPIHFTAICSKNKFTKPLLPGVTEILTTFRNGALADQTTIIGSRVVSKYIL